MLIPWYIGWPIVIAFGVGILAWLLDRLDHDSEALCM
jgi:hypothetical protein